nr:MAG TPA: Transcriptional regulator, RHH-like, CopG [Caudoviricetes sp.]DAQ05380.1 MAG TPA: Transcriptional regulator, RHH-like, CopG [Caudoviricetes sp.]
MKRTQTHLAIKQSDKFKIKICYSFKYLFGSKSPLRVFMQIDLTNEQKRALERLGKAMR